MGIGSLHGPRAALHGAAEESTIAYAKSRCNIIAIRRIVEKLVNKSMRRMMKSNAKNWKGFCIRQIFSGARRGYVHQLNSLTEGIITYIGAKKLDYSRFFQILRPHEYMPGKVPSLERGMASETRDGK